jgi:hypothetical protein
MTPTASGSVLGRRAMPLLVAACAAADRPVVAVPALFCAEIVDGLHAAGVRVRYYDVAPDLAPPYAALDRVMDDDIGAVVWHHPFGVYHAPPDLPGVVVVEDGCLATRTFVGRGLVEQVRDIAVFSLRKEFGWSHGGLALGPRARTLAALELRPGAVTRGRWHGVDLAAAVAAGRAATAKARDVLSGHLPAAAPGDVRSALPLLSDDRDDTVRRLRAGRILAWYWRRPLPGLSERHAPVAAALWQRLLVVPTPADPAEYAAILATEPCPWPAEQ